MTSDFNTVMSSFDQKGRYAVHVHQTLMYVLKSVKSPIFQQLEQCLATLGSRRLAM